MTKGSTVAHKNKHKLHLRQDGIFIVKLYHKGNIWQQNNNFQKSSMQIIIFNNALGIQLPEV
jgi:hypothetical protein